MVDPPRLRATTIDDLEPKKLSRRLKLRRDALVRILGRFDDQALDRVSRLASEAITSDVDGYKAATRLGPSTGGTPRHEASCPAQDGRECECPASAAEGSITERAALRLAEGGGSKRDPQHVAMKRIKTAFDVMWTEIIAAERSWDVILHASDAIREREAQSTLGTCQACHRNDVPNVGHDRIKAGYCPACYTAWQRTAGPGGRQDRLTFEAGRARADVDEAPWKPDEDWQ